MNCHAVRDLRVCEVCGALGNKQAFLNQYGDLCPLCALRRSGSLKGFMTMYNKEEWDKIPLSVVGVRGMRQLLKARYE